MKDSQEPQFRTMLSWSAARRMGLAALIVGLLWMAIAWAVALP